MRYSTAFDTEEEAEGFIKKVLGAISETGKLRLQIFLIKCIYQFLKSKESDRVIGKELKEDMLKRIAGLDATIRVLTDESRGN